MLIDDILDITEGRLLNTPFISSVEEIHINSSLVKRGDLFIAINDEGIKEAIKNGAYGILMDESYDVIDEEIAWIKTDNLERALSRLVKYFFIDKEYNFILLNPLQFHIVSTHLNNKKEIAILSLDIKNNFNMLMNKKKKIFFTTDEEFLIRLKLSFFKYTNFILPEHSIVNESIFDTEFIYNSYRSHIRIAPLFFEDFLRLFHFLNDFGVHIELKNIHIKDSFIPYFLGDQGELLDFGKSDRVLIAEEDTLFLNQEIKYLLENVRWSKLSIFINEKNKAVIDKRYEKEIRFYSDQEELINNIKKETIGYIFIDGINDSILKQVKSNHYDGVLF
jgi:ferrochelatase